MSTKNKSNEIKITRIYDAPVTTVWEAWTDPDQVAKWWGPRGFSITTHSKDLRVGGHWHYTMHGPDGTDYPNKTVYFEVEEYKRLVYDHGANDDQPALFRVTVLFKDLKGKTQMEMTMTLPTAEQAEQTKKFIKEANGNSTWDRLAEYLEKEDSNDDIFVLNRSFEAPIETLFEMWTNPQHLSQWLAPTGVRMETLSGEIKEKETLFYKMTNDIDLTMFGKINYIKISKPEHLQYTNIFCTEDGEVSRHPMLNTWPEVIFSDIKFSSEPDNQTRVTVTWRPYGQVSPEELKAFIDMKSGMNQGWTGSFDKLEKYLK
ncbi:MAG: SRPBCC domain-containing protein [Bdellovibrionales bacterium]|nr:SRPBCC domain-containing protein [Bdellovibrionales bacterium]